MSLTAQDIEIITRLLKDSAFDELHLEMDGLKLTLRREGAVPVMPARAGAAVADIAGTPAQALPTAAGVARTPPAAAGDVPHATGVYAALQPGAPAQTGTGAAARGTVVTAPLLGTFYRAARPGAPPFVEVGAEVEPDTVVGIIEVMKLMNAVHAGTHGRVIEILVQDGAVVEYAQPLLRVDPRHG